MEPRILRIFYGEIGRQCKFALMAREDLDRALSFRDMDRIWYSIQGLLIAAANISKFLWPTGKIPRLHQIRRCAELRMSLSVGDDSPFQSRGFRNHFEHFDERLEKWMKSSKRKNFVDSNLGPVEKAITGIDKEDYLRNFDPEKSELTFRGDSYPLKPVIEEIQKLWEKIREKNNG